MKTMKILLITLLTALYTCMPAFGMNNNSAPIIKTMSARITERTGITRDAANIINEYAPYENTDQNVMTLTKEAVDAAHEQTIFPTVLANIVAEYAYARTPGTDQQIATAKQRASHQPIDKGIRATTPLMSAAGHGQEDAVEQLLIEDFILAQMHGKPSDINTQDEIGCTALHHAVKWQRYMKDNINTDVTLQKRRNIVRQLLEHGANPNIETHLFRLSPLHFAALERNHPDVVAFLLEAGAEIDSADHKGSSPLHMAAENNNVQAVSTLVCNGADNTLRDKNNQTALDMAKRSVIKAILTNPLRHVDSIETDMFMFTRSPQSSPRASPTKGMESPARRNSCVVPFFNTPTNDKALVVTPTRPGKKPLVFEPDSDEEEEKKSN